MSNPNDPTRPAPDQPDPDKPDATEKQQAGEGRPQAPRSAFDFELPPEAGSSSRLPPIPQTDAPDTGRPGPSLPPRPAATERPSTASFDFIELPTEHGSGVPPAGGER
jgi:hypothetical protein